VRAQRDDGARNAAAASLNGTPAEDHRSQALWAADCAERALSCFERPLVDRESPQRTQRSQRKEGQ
jgi:hypothetical protein